MTTTHTTNETPSPASESVSGQTFGADSRGHDTTSRARAQLLEKRVRLSRGGDIFIAASAPGQIISLAFIDGRPLIAQKTLSLDEAAALAAALDELITDLTLNAQARAWSQRMCDHLSAPASEPA